MGYCWHCVVREYPCRTLVSISVSILYKKHILACFGCAVSESVRGGGEAWEGLRQGSEIVRKAQQSE